MVNVAKSHFQQKNTKIQNHRECVPIQIRMEWSHEAHQTQMQGTLSVRKYVEIALVFQKIEALKHHRALHAIRYYA